MAVVAAMMANQGYADDGGTSPGFAMGDVAILGGWIGADYYRNRKRREASVLGARLKMSPRTGPTLPWMAKNAKTNKWEASSKFTGELKGWGAFSKEADKIAEGRFESQVARKSFKSSATRLFGAARTEALLTSGLRIANAAMLVPMLFGMTYHGFKGIQRLGFELERPGFGWGRNTLSSMAFTDRQRSVQAMHNSEFNGRSSMGQEAFLLHQ